MPYGIGGGSGSSQEPTVEGTSRVRAKKKKREIFKNDAYGLRTPSLIGGFMNGTEITPPSLIETTLSKVGGDNLIAKSQSAASAAVCPHRSAA